MTDFLEELLKEQEEENQEQTWAALPDRSAQGQSVSGNTGANTEISRSGRQNESVQETETAGRRIDQKLWDEKTQKERLEAMEDKGFLYAGKRNWQAGTSGELNGDIPRTEAGEMALADSMKRVHRAVQMRVKQNIWTAGNPAQMFGHDDGVYRGPTKKEHYASNYAALVDAAFARDARRYDGPLRLL